MVDENFEHILQIAKERNVKLRLLSKDEVTEWGVMSQYQNVLQAWAKEQQAKGMPNVEKVLAQMEAILNAQTAAVSNRRYAISYEGYHLYYPNRRQNSPLFQALVAELKS